MTYVLVIYDIEDQEEIVLQHEAQWSHLLHRVGSIDTSFNYTNTLYTQIFKSLLHIFCQYSFWKSTFVYTRLSLLYVHSMDNLYINCFVHFPNNQGMGVKNATNIALVSHSRKLYVLEYSNYKDYLQLMNLYLLKSPPPPFPLP